MYFLSSFDQTNFSCQLVNMSDIKSNESSDQLTNVMLSDVQKQLKDFDEKLAMFSKNSKQVYDPLDVLIHQMKRSPSETDMALYEHYLDILELQRKTVNKLADIQLVLLNREELLKQRLQEQQLEEQRLQEQRLEEQSE